MTKIIIVKKKRKQTQIIGKHFELSKTLLFNTVYLKIVNFKFFWQISPPKYQEQ